jgi:hypothetical protein
MRLLFFFLSFLSINIIHSQSIEQFLKENPSITYSKIVNSQGFVEAYEVLFPQLIDHQDSSKGSFKQRIWLGHRSSSSPTVIATEGYQAYRMYVYEPTHIFAANQLEVEHRFFGKSIPENMDYTYLTIEQATADLHAIRVFFGKFYSGKWLSTGISKGGETTLYYRYFYPNDVQVSIPYVAPLALALNDSRIYHFFDTVGTATNRQQLKEVQFKLLQNREKSLKYIKKSIRKRNLEFHSVTVEEAFELAVLEYPFSFWQWHGDTNVLPNTNVSIKKMVKHLLAISDVDFYADEEMKRLGSHYYQSGTQLGYYSYETEEFKGLLPAVGDTTEVSAIFMPNNQEMTFTSTLPEAVFEWATNQGDSIIYINGAIDPWASTAVPISEGVDAVWFFLAGKHHGQARIKNFTEAEQKVFNDAIFKWLGIKL